jgi:hypothetical protein
MNQEPGKYDSINPVNKAIGRHTRKVMKKYEDYLNREMAKKTFPNGLEASRYLDKLAQGLLDKEKDTK